MFAGHLFGPIDVQPSLDSQKAPQTHLSDLQCKIISSCLNFYTCNHLWPIKNSVAVKEHSLKNILSLGKIFHFLMQDEMHCSQVGPNLGTRVPMGPFFSSDFVSPKGPHFFSRSPLSPFQAEECAKSQSSHYLINVDNLNTCDGKTSFNLYIK